MNFTFAVNPTNVSDVSTYTPLVWIEAMSVILAMSTTVAVDRIAVDCIAKSLMFAIDRRSCLGTFS